MAISTVLIALAVVGIAGGFLGSFGHVVVLGVLALTKKGRAILPSKGFAGSVTVIVPVHQEAKDLRRKCLMLLDGPFPADRIQLLVAADGPVEGLSEALAAPLDLTVELLQLPRCGKAALLSEAARHATGEIIVVSDRDAKVGNGDLARLLAVFSDPAIGGACGNVVIDREKDDSQRAYWKIENVARRWENQWLGNLTANSGALTAIRQSYWKPIPEECSDDLFLALNVFLQDARFVYVEEARAKIPPRSQGVWAAVRRQARIVTGSMYTLWHCRTALNPFRSGAFALVLLFHKVFRRLVPFFAALVGLALFVWSVVEGHQGLALAIAGAASAGAVVLPLGSRYSHVFRKILWLCAIQLGMAIGVARFLANRHVKTW